MVGVAFEYYVLSQAYQKHEQISDPYYDGVEFCRRSGRGMHLPVGQTGHLDGAYDPVDGVVSRTSPGSEMDGKSHVQRRRIAVAVSP